MNNYLDLILEQLKADVNFAIDVLGYSEEEAGLYALKKANGEIKDNIN